MDGGVLELGDTTDRISVNFDVSEGGNIKMELITYTGYYTDSNKYARIDRTKVYVDDVLRTITLGNESECVTVWNWYYCPYYIDADLTTGIHKLEIESANSKLRLDRFRYSILSSSVLVPNFNVNYGTWIQAENSYVIESDPNSNIKVLLSSSFSGDMDGAVLELPDTLDKISYSFFAEDSGDYIFDLYTYTGYNTYDDPYSRIDRTKIYIDGVELLKYKGDLSGCVTVWGSHFCSVLVAINLNSGEHTLEVESVNSRIRVDRFRYGIRSSIVIPVTWNLVQEDTLPIFGYHSVLNDNELITEPTLEIHKTDFINQIDYANNVLGCKWYTLADLVNNYISKDIKIPKNACAMNFDDGALNNYEVALPILIDKGVVATFYIVTNYIDQGFSGYVNWDQVVAIRDAGNEIASHTMNHKDLTTLTLNDANLEIANSKQMLVNHGFNVSTFAYPFGAQNDLIIELVKNNGFIAARDTEKYNTWRRKPSVTTSADIQSNYRYLFNYYKPELVSNTQIKEDIFYNYRWQFEEGYRIDVGTSAGVFPLSSTTPTTTSYAVLNLDDSHKISSNFLVYNNGEYKIEIFGSTGINDSLQYFNYLYKKKSLLMGLNKVLFQQISLQKNVMKLHGTGLIVLTL
ncbi:polysaccharide deacetylase family protein [Candidatus Gracilibacteria bacterium]|nr:polysaccharide deacetylase family protein [Candidatus Gracilibacteria bacterium]